VVRERGSTSEMLGEVKGGMIKVKIGLVEGEMTRDLGGLRLDGRRRGSGGAGEEGRASPAAYEASVAVSDAPRVVNGLALPLPAAYKIHKQAAGSEPTICLERRDIRAYRSNS
jgi:hypothetical protein